MVKKILIIGKGSISFKHKKALSLINKKITISQISSRKFSNNYFKKKKKEDYDYFIICSPSTYHFKHINIVEKNFRNKKVLIEKPLFDKFHNFKKKLKNSFFVGYNLRFHPLIIYLKNFLIRKKIYSVNILSHSYLPGWRKINYKKSVSSNKNLGGGVLLELSHELDFLNWIFKDIKIISVFNKKISDLKINVDDILNISGILKKNIYFNLNINFFSRLNRRIIKVDGKDFCLIIDLINNSIEVFNKKIKKNKKLSNFKMINTYKNQHLEIINNKLLYTCSLREALNLMKLIRNIKNHD